MDLPQPVPVSGTPSLSLLPNELLLHIFEKLVPRLYSRKAYQSKLVSILPVCRRWNALFEPMFLHTLSLGPCDGPTPKQYLNMLINIKKHPRLAQYLRCISLQLCDPDSAAVYSMAAYILYHSTAIHKLSLDLTWSAEAQIVIQATKSLQHLESLTLSDPDDSPD